MKPLKPFSLSHENAAIIIQQKSSYTKQVSTATKIITLFAFTQYHSLIWLLLRNFSSHPEINTLERATTFHIWI
jgi:hypothetical protein